VEHDSVRRVARVLLAVLLAVHSTGALEAARAGATSTVPDVVAVPPPLVVMSGHVMMKDGITPVVGAELVLTGALDGDPRSARSGRSGSYKLKAPAGKYRLQITRKMEIYKAPAVFRMPASGRIQVDLLLLPDFEPDTAVGSRPAERPSITAGPDPLPTSPVVVGSVVDMVHSKSARRWSRWAEALGFLGGLLAVAVAAD